MLLYYFCRGNKLIFYIMESNLQIDALDHEILRLLGINARYSYAQLGREIGLSPSAVAERVQKLEENGVIEGYAATINYAKLGYPLAAYITMNFSGDNYKRFFKELSQFPEIITCSRITGNDCLIMKVRLRNGETLAGLVDRLLVFGKPTTSLVLSEL